MDTLTKKALKRTPINKIGKVGKQWLVTRTQWIRNNPPPIDGQYWECYLQIHPWCPKRLDIAALTLDHVVSRTREPGLRFTAENIQPACYFCNKAKGSRSLEELKGQTI